MMQSDECNEIGRIVGSELDVDVEGLNDIRFNGSATHGAPKCHFDRPCSASIPHRYLQKRFLRINFDPNKTKCVSSNLIQVSA